MTLGTLDVAMQAIYDLQKRVKQLEGEIEKPRQNVLVGGIAQDLSGYLKRDGSLTWTGKHTTTNLGDVFGSEFDDGVDLVTNTGINNRYVTGGGQELCGMIAGYDDVPHGGGFDFDGLMGTWYDAALGMPVFGFYSITLDMMMFEFTPDGFMYINGNTDMQSWTTHAASALGGSITVDADNTWSIGTGTAELKDIFVDGTANIDTLSLDTTEAFGCGVSTDFKPTLSNSKSLGSTTRQWKDLYIDGFAYIDDLRCDVMLDIDGALDISGIDIAGGGAGAFQRALPVTYSGGAGYIYIYNAA